MAERYPECYLIYSEISTYFFYAIYAALIVGNLIWYMPLIAKLQHKEFHICMFTLNNLSFVVNLVVFYS